MFSISLSDSHMYTDTTVYDTLFFNKTEVALK